MLKFAESMGSLDVIEARRAHSGDRLIKDSHRHNFDYEPRIGMLYVRSRAISSRVNDNFDGFPAEEIKKAYSTFIGKPVFVNHHNSDHRKMRGLVIDAVLHEDVNPDGSPDTWVEALMEVDAIKYPKLAEAIINRDIERTSMGTDVAFSRCSVCDNKAVSPTQYCRHVKAMKGQTVYRKNAATGREEPVLVSEICLTPDTPILMSDGAEVPIAQVTVGDLVLDHLGEPRRVLETTTREVDEDLVVIERVGFWKPVRVTSNHPVLVLKREDTASGQRKWMKARLASGKIAPEFIPASEIQPGDFVAEVMPSPLSTLSKIIPSDWEVPNLDRTRQHPPEKSPDRFYVPEKAWRGRAHILRTCRAQECDNEMDLYPSESDRLYCSSKCWGDGCARGNSSHAGSDAKVELPDTIEMDHNFGRWCGWFLSEGSISHQKTGDPRGVIFGLHRNEENEAQEIERLGLDLFGLVAVHKVKGNGRTVEFSNAPLSRFMRVLGDGFYTKALPDEWLSAPIEFISAVVHAHHDGDGEHGGGRVGGVIDPAIMQHATSSPRLADQLHVLHLMLGHTPTRKRPDPAGGKGKRTVPGHSVRSRLDHDAQTRMKWGRWVFGPVRSVTTEHYFGSVHNLEVEDTHTYVANHMAVHNCYGLGFFENSLLVEEPADPTAYTWGVDTRGLQTAGITTSASSNAAYITQSSNWPIGKIALDTMTSGGNHTHAGENGRSFCGAPASTSGETSTMAAFTSVTCPRCRTEVRKQMPKLSSYRKTAAKDSDDMTIEPDSIEPGWINAWIDGICVARINTRNFYVSWIDGLNDRSKTKAAAISTIKQRLDRPSYRRLLTESPVGSAWPKTKTSSYRKQAINEQKAPPEVDTLREEACPICSEVNAYTGDRCSICGFVKPPDEFLDPDLDAAKNVNLRQDETEADDATNVEAPTGGTMQDFKVDPAAGGAAAGGSMKQFKVSSMDSTNVIEALTLLGERAKIATPSCGASGLPVRHVAKIINGHKVTARILDWNEVDVIQYMVYPSSELLDIHTAAALISDGLSTSSQRNPYTEGQNSWLWS